MMKPLKKYLMPVFFACCLIFIGYVHFLIEDKRQACESRGGVLIKAGGYGWQCLSVDALK